MDIRQLIDEKLAILKNNGIASSKFELRILLGEVLGISPAEVYCYKRPLTSEQIMTLDTMIGKRIGFCPVDKIIGHKGFYKYEFAVNNDVLSPRADTEILVEEAIKIIKDKHFNKILEFGVGSGCIILSLLADTINTYGVGVDISEKALEVAKQNASRLNVDDRISLITASWFDNDIDTKAGKEFDIIVSNPPYIPSSEIKLLDKEVKDFDPIQALDGGSDGLRDYRQICKIAKQLLKDEGYILFEFGEGQADSIREIGKLNNLICKNVLKDLNGIERCIILKK